MNRIVTFLAGAAGFIAAVVLHGPVQDSPTEAQRARTNITSVELAPYIVEARDQLVRFLQTGRKSGSAGRARF